MIMADKIIELRKKNGWSQEELAAQLKVSRQSVSKWEGAQSVPDLNKVIAMADLFGVSTDYLLRDSMGKEEVSLADGFAGEDGLSYVGDGGTAEPVRRVSMEEANAYLALAQQASGQISAGVVLCVLSPIFLIMIALAAEEKHIPLSVDHAGIAGTAVLLLLVAVAVAFFVKNGMQLSKYSYLEEEIIDTEYGVTGMVKERKREFEHTHLIAMTVGIIICVLSAIPILCSAVLESNMLSGVGVSITLLLVAVGTGMIVKVSIIWESYQKLLEEGDYSRRTKRSAKGVVSGVFWLAAVAVYLAYSFWTMDWKRSWIIWPVAGVLYALVIKIAEAKEQKR